MPPDPSLESAGEIPAFDPDRILFHGGGLLVVDKPAGIPVHQGTGNPHGVVEVLAEWVHQNPGILDIRPGKTIHPIHRIDLEATGVLVLGLTRPATRLAKKAFAEGDVRQRHLAVVAGPLPETGRLRGRVRSRSRGVYSYLKAELSYNRLRGDERLSLVEVFPQGSRRHQIRSLFAQAGHPLAGDLRYGKPKPARQFLAKFSLDWLLLHTREIVLPAGVLGGERVFEAPIPEAFLRLSESKGWESL